MRHLTKTAAKTFAQILGGLDRPGQHRKIDTAPDAFMAVHVDVLDRTRHGLRVALAHNFVQNGDVMADPDVTFLVSSVDGQVYPLTFQADATGFHQEGGRIDGDRILSAPRVQADITRFANQWMRNIKAQQTL